MYEKSFLLRTFSPEKDVPNVKLCRRLKRLGYPQDGGGWYWIIYHDDDGDRYQLVLERERDKKFWNMLKNCSEDYREVIKAPTIGELGWWLSFHWTSSKGRVFYSMPFDKGFICESIDKDGFIDEFIETKSETEADARAKMLIKLLEGGFIQFSIPKK